VNNRRNKTDQLEAEINRLAKACKLEGWNSFVTEMTMPGSIYLPLATGRPELIRVIKPIDLTAEQVAPMLNVIATLIETNVALRDHAAQLAHLVETWADAFKHLHGVGEKIERFANFKSNTTGDEDDA
jgi:hypothetical protein